MSHYEQAVRELERADHIVNADGRRDDREGPATRALLTAQVHATLALAEATNAVAKSNYDGRV